jgi:hypothetical protein
MVLILGLVLSLPVLADDNKLPGTWEVTGTPDPASMVDPFVNLARISKDGGIVNVDPSEGTAVGGWKYLGAGHYVVTFHGFLPGGLRFKVEGLVQTVDGGSRFTGPFVTDVMDPGGNVVFSFSGTVTGIRI